MKEAVNESIHQTFSYGVIYAYSIPDEAHDGRLKIGSATSHDTTTESIEKAAHDRIKQQTGTSDVQYKLELAQIVRLPNGRATTVDKPIHDILIRTGINRKSNNKIAEEWFETNIETVRNAINAAEAGRPSLKPDEDTSNIYREFPFRPNQLEAIKKTNAAISAGKKHYLWNAKMRFGKTSAAMQVAKENEMQRVLIVTHRPSVSIDWFDDFKKIFAGSNQYEFGSKERGANIEDLTKRNNPFIYFASLQDLRLSEDVLKDERAKSTKEYGFAKNKEIFSINWDMLIVDEAHEGTQSNLGDTTLELINNRFRLELSGTPFNILHKLDDSSVYTWDYVMEQEEKQNWDTKHPGVPNPYAELPQISMFTYEIDKFISHSDLGVEFIDTTDKAFNFHEFFRVNKESGEFVHKNMVNKFIDLMTKNEQFPYSSKELREYNKHSLWLLPNRTDVIKAMENLLSKHTIFGDFGIVNISGNMASDDNNDKDAKDKVKNAIKNYEFTITLTGERLTTGASIKEWTAVFMMSNTNSATTYLQTAFRCQTPALINGKMKTQAYIFDFAPDRTLKLVAEAIELNHKSGKSNTPEQKDAMKKFLNFCPILAAKNGKMSPFDVNSMLNQLKKAIIQRVARNGFDDPKLYNDELLKMDGLQLEEFNKLQGIIGKSNPTRPINNININETGMTEEEIASAEEAERKKKLKKELTPKELEILEKEREAKRHRDGAIKILRGVSIRMPMLVFGAPNVKPNDDLTLKSFIEQIDDESWKEFMPEGLEKDFFNNTFAKYYDEEVFRGVCHNILAQAYDADSEFPFERIMRLADIFNTFRNPDKETILTPWNVVNMHMSDTLGGNDFRALDENTGLPNDTGDPLKIWENSDIKVLEINSKSGLYPLLAAYNIYSKKLYSKIKAGETEDKVFRELWAETLRNNVYVVCKSPMAKSITQRTLRGYSVDKNSNPIKTNVIYVPNLVNKLKRTDFSLMKELKKEFDQEGGDRMIKFDVVVGNPPYQELVAKNSDSVSQANPVYNEFVLGAISLDPRYISVITPSLWLTQGTGLDSFRKKMLSDNKISILHDFFDANSIFPSVSIGGGVSYFLWDSKHSGKTLIYEHDDRRIVESKRHMNEFGNEYYIRDSIGAMIISKIGAQEKEYLSFMSIFSTYSPFAKGQVGNYKHLWKDQPSNKTVTIYKNPRSPGGGKAYIDRDKIIGHTDWIDKHKVFVSKAGDVSARFNGNPFHGTPGTVCTETYMVVGPFENGYECENCIKYMNTNLYKYLVSQLKKTQNAARSVYRFVPLQDFTNKSDIDWTKSIPEIDSQLFEKYNLSKEEIDCIGKKVKPME